MNPAENAPLALARTRAALVEEGTPNALKTIEYIDENKDAFQRMAVNLLANTPQQYPTGEAIQAAALTLGTTALVLSTKGPPS